MSEAPAIGIDLGTTYRYVDVCVKHRVSSSSSLSAAAATQTRSPHCF
jgi:hypothetical protein